MTGPQKKEYDRLLTKYRTVGLNGQEVQRRHHLETVARNEVDQLASQLSRRWKHNARKEAR